MDHGVSGSASLCEIPPTLKGSVEARLIWTRKGANEFDFYICRMFLCQFLFFFPVVSPLGLLHRISVQLHFDQNQTIAWRRQNEIWTFRQKQDHMLELKLGRDPFEWRGSLMSLCFMSVSSRETPACLAAPEVCTKCPTGAPRQAQGTSAQSRLFSMTTRVLCEAPPGERGRNQKEIGLSVILFICNEMFRPPDPSGDFGDWTQAVRRTRRPSSFHPSEGSETRSDSRVETKPSLSATVAAFVATGHWFSSTAPQKIKQGWSCGPGVLVHRHAWTVTWGCVS